MAEAPPIPIGRPEPAAAPIGEFPRIGGAAEPPAAPTLRRRLFQIGLAAANRLIPKSPGKVVLHSATDLEDGIIAVSDELVRRGWKPVVFLEDRNKAPLARRMLGGEPTLVPKHSRAALLHFLTARYVLMTHGMFGDPPPPKNQVVVNLWHGEPPAKVVGLFEGQPGRKSTYAPVLSTVGRAYRAAEFGLNPLQVPVIGAPRNDRLMRADGDEARARLLGQTEQRTVFFWLPTFRAASHGGRVRVDVQTRHPGVPYPPEDVRAIDDWLAENDAMVVLKPHPHDMDAFNGKFKSIRVLRQEEMEALDLTLYTVLPAFDALISDVSSIWMDYLLVDKPIILAFPDIDEYRAARGINLEPYEAWAPGPFVRSVDELLAAMDGVVAGHDPLGELRRQARMRFHRYHDDCSTARLLDGLGITSSARPG